MNDEWEERVRVRAHAIWEREGRPDGGAEQHWVLAEEELRAEGAGTTNRGDEAAPGTPGTGEDICPACNGTGTSDGKTCTNCGGTGKVTAGLGGG
jgi:hypothetical protein